MNRDEANTLETDLLQRIARKDAVAFAQFYDRTAPVLFSIAMRMLRDPKEAEDVIQESFLQVWDKASTFDPALGRPLAWAVRLTRNKVIDRIRAHDRRARLLNEAAAEFEVMAHTVCLPEWSDQGQLIRGALAALPPEQKQPIELAFFAGKTQTEIATALNQPLGTIKARIRRGLLKLRETLEKQG